MAEIKSALELALQRSEGITVDKEKLQAKEFKITGRKAAIAFIDGKTDAKEFSKSFKQIKGAEQTGFVSGAAEIFLSYIKLPSNDDYKEAFAVAAEGTSLLSDHQKDIKQMFDQLSGFMDQYLQTRQQIETQLKAQFEPILRQKEEALRAQTGSSISINPMDDPSFQKAYSQNIGKLEQSYLEPLNQAKAQLKQFLGIEQAEA